MQSFVFNSLAIGLAIIIFLFSGYPIKLLTNNKVSSFYPLASERIAGYCLISLLGFFSLIVCHTIKLGVLLGAIISITSFFLCNRNINFKLNLKNIDNYDYTYFLIFMVFFSAIAFSYIGILLFAGTHYQLVEVFDLPKNISAVISVLDATQWPTPNPYFPSLPFTYNIIFYIPIAAIVKISKNLNFIYSSFSIALLWVVWNSLALIKEVIAKFTTSKLNQIIGLIFCSFFAGYTAFFIHSDVILAFLYGNPPPAFWADEPFIDYIYIPQHIFSILCIIASWLYLNSSLSFNKRVPLQFFLLTTAALVSYLLAPIAYIVFTICLIINTITLYRDFNFKSIAGLIISTSMFLLLTLPFLLIAKNWAGQLDATYFTLPHFSLDWKELLVEYGIILFYAGLGVYIFFKKYTTLHLTYILIAMAGLFTIYIMHCTTDSAIKSTLYLRLTMVPLAVIGISHFFSYLKSKNYALLLSLGIFPFVLSFSLSFINIGYFTSDALIALTSTETTFLQSLRLLPFKQVLYLPTTDQIQAALSGHLVYMDESPIRNDLYLPSVQRSYAKAMLSQWKLKNCVPNTLLVLNNTILKTNC